MPTSPTIESLLARLRAFGYTVAVHNDYRLAGRLYTFWLLTHEHGHYLKAEALTDTEALVALTSQAEVHRKNRDRVSRDYPGCQE